MPAPGPAIESLFDRLRENCFQVAEGTGDRETVRAAATEFPFALMKPEFSTFSRPSFSFL
jgi:hypothetical protein